jgi:hypothetical protein
MVAPVGRDAAAIFISHASSETNRAQAVAARLNEQGFETLLDADLVRAGDSFVQFMERALADARYCLLLWSRAAERGPWVATEWHAALVRSVQEKSAFLITGRLEEIPVPMLLASRRWIDLFPQLAPGIDELLALLGDDRCAARATSKPVAPSRHGGPTAGASNMVYVTSSLFDVTTPVDAELDAPAGVLLDRLVAAWQLPTYQPLDPRGRIAVRVAYTLLHAERRLDRGERLSAAGVRHADILILQSEFQFVAATEPATAASAGSVFRGSPCVSSDPAAPGAALVRQAGALMRSAARHAGLLRGRR